MPKARQICYIGVLLLVTARAAALQDKPSSKPVSPQQPYKISTDLVAVQAVVLEKSGRPVMDLRPGDFQVYEDDVPQTIVFFEAAPGLRHSPAQKGSPRPSPSIESVDEVGGRDSAEDPEMIVLLLDYSTTTVANQKLVRDGARRYVAQHMDGEERLAVFAFDSGLHSLQSPTQDKSKVMAVLDRSGSRGDAMAGEHEALRAGAAEAVGRQEALSTQIGQVLGSAGSGAPSPVAVVALAMMQTQLDMARYTELQYYSLKSALDDQLSRSILLAIRAIVRGVAPFPGRKTLILLSQGFVVPPNVRGILDSTLSDAIRSNTSIYSIDARGLLNDKPIFQTTELESISALQRGTRSRVVNGETEFDRAAMIGTDQEESLLRYLALATGGLYLRNNNDLARGLKLVHQDVHSRYLLGYYSTNKKMDGTFRAIRVEVHRPGLKVRARKGYFAEPNKLQSSKTQN